MWRDMKLVAMKEFWQSLTNREITIGMAILPFYLGIIMPLSFGSIPIPGFIETTLPLILILLLSFMGSMGSSIFVVYAFAGEREANTLPTLLSTRLSDSALVFGKMLFSFVTAFILNIFTLITFMTTLSIRLGSISKAVSPILNPTFAIGVFFIPLLFALFSIAVGMLISTKILNTKAASGVSVLPEIPIIGAFGFLLIANPFRLSQMQNILVICAILVAFTSLFMVITLGLFKRERMIAR